MYSRYPGAPWQAASAGHICLLQISNAGGVSPSHDLHLLRIDSVCVEEAEEEDLLTSSVFSRIYGTKLQLTFKTTAILPFTLFSLFHSSLLTIAYMEYL